MLGSLSKHFGFLPAFFVDNAAQIGTTETVESGLLSATTTAVLAKPDAAATQTADAQSSSALTGRELCHTSTHLDQGNNCSVD